MHLKERNLPRIVLLDCAQDVVTSLEAAGYDIAIGYTGYFAEHPTVDIPPALHEKDLIVVDLDPGWAPRPPAELYPHGTSVPKAADHLRDPDQSKVSLGAFNQALRRGGMVFCLLEGVTRPPGRNSRERSLSWLPGSVWSSPGQRGPATVTIEKDEYLHLPDPLPLAPSKFPELKELLSSSAQEVTSFRTLTGVHPLLLNESGAAKAGFYAPSEGGLVWLLPYFRRKPAALHRLIGSVLPKIDAELFPPRKTEWGQEDAYQLSAVLDIRSRRAKLEADHQQALAELDAEEADAALAQEPFTQMLRARGEDLHPVVRDALMWLEFEVVDHDAIRREAGGRLEEDLQIKDGAYFALVEITSSRGNAKDKDFMDLEKYRTWRAKSPGRDDIDVTDIRGMLIVNQMYREEPARREPLYASSRDMDWPQHASETGITIVSTWELFKLIRRVDSGDISKAQARAELELPGLFIASA